MFFGEPSRFETFTVLLFKCFHPRFKRCWAPAFKSQPLISDSHKWMCFGESARHWSYHSETFSYKTFLLSHNSYCIGLFAIVCSALREDRGQPFRWDALMWEWSVSNCWSWRVIKSRSRLQRVRIWRTQSAKRGQWLSPLHPSLIASWGGQWYFKANKVILRANWNNNYSTNASLICAYYSILRAFTLKNKGA